MDATRTPSFTRTDAGYTAWNGETLLGRVERSGRAWVATTASNFTLGEQYATRAEAGLALAVVAERVARLEAIADAAEPGQPAEGPQDAPAAEARPLTGELRHEAHCKRNGGVWADPCTCTPRYWTRQELDAARTAVIEAEEQSRVDANRRAPAEVGGAPAYPPLSTEEAVAALDAGLAFIADGAGSYSFRIEEHRTHRQLGKVRAVTEELGRGYWVRYAAYRPDGSRVGYADNRRDAAVLLRDDARV